MLQKYVNLRTLKVFWFFFLFLIRKIDGKVPEHSKLRHTHRRDAKVSEYFLMKYPVDRSSYSEEMHNKRFCVAYAYLLPKDKAISRIGLLSQEAFSRKSVTVFRRTRDAGILVLDLNLPGDLLAIILHT